MNGLVLIDKPAGCTSHDVVNRWRKLAQTRRVGHLGTLDPMATGLLALLTGPATRLAQFYEREDKTYQAVIRLGVISDTYDAEGVVERTGMVLPCSHAIHAALDHFRGSFEQTPPAVSAKKIAGVPAYKLARKKLPVELAPVAVEIKELIVHQMTQDELNIEVTCSSGTYIRSLAHDLGNLLGCGALLASLRRTRIGGLRLSDAHTLDELTSLAQNARLESVLVPAGQVLAHLPAEHVSEQTEALIRQGRYFHTSPFVVPAGAPLVRALSRSGDLIAVGTLVVPNVYHPGTVLAC